MSLDLQSLSITSVFNSIVNFFKSQENNSKWRDLSNNSEGSFLIRLLSNVFSAISYRIVAQCRENYLSTAALRSSATGIAVNLGYSVYRGSNVKKKLRIKPDADYVYPKFSVIGSYSTDYDIICLEETALKKDEEQEVKVVIGSIKEETLTAGTSAIKVFTLFTSNISEDYVLYLGSTEVPTTKVIKELVDDNYLVRTNPYGSVDIMYLNTYPNFKYKYGADSEFTLRYVELEDISLSALDSSMLNCGELVSYTGISSFIGFESVEDIKVNAPLDHELQNLIRSKADYANRLKEIVPAVDDANYEALTPTYTLISYLKNDLTLLTAAEREEVNSLLSHENFFGTPLPDVEEPRREVAALDISMCLTNKYKDVSEIKIDIQNILSNYYDYSLGIEFNVYDLERKLESLSYVKYARVSHKINSRKTGANYQLGYILNKDDNYYIASKVLGVSGSTTPKWAIPAITPTTIDTGLETTDGSVIWRTYRKLTGIDTTLISAWEANFHYGIGEYVTDPSYPGYMFKCVDLVKNSGSTTPDLSAVSNGDFIIDGNIVWVVKDYVETDTWAALTNYRLGDSVNLTSTTYSLECISYTGTAGTDADLEFEMQNYPILTQTLNAFTIEGEKTYYIRQGDIISANSTTGYDTYSVLSSAYNSTTDITTVTLNQELENATYTSISTEARGTRDGQILWKLIDDIEDVTYTWNSYVTFSYDLDIID